MTKAKAKAKMTARGKATNARRSPAPKENKHWLYEEVPDSPASAEEPTIDTNAPRQTRGKKQLAEPAPRPRPRPKKISAPSNTDTDETFIISRKRGTPESLDQTVHAPVPIPTGTDERGVPVA
ncbi:hypothetical protein H0H92_006887 [Tricholoma furcatifolium]|nr:hypothetical protein H0H92_006887 [Tricholoma furcatifolium]